MILIFIIFFYSSLYSQDFDENSFFPILPSMEKEFENARYLNSVSSWQNEIQNEFLSISNLWNDEVENKISFYLNKITSYDIVNSNDNYKLEFYNYAEGLKEKIYNQWKENIYETIIKEGINFYNSLTQSNSEKTPYYEEQNDYFTQLNSIEIQKNELLEDVLQTDLLYQNNYNQMVSMENEVRQSVFTLAKELKSYLKENDIYYELDSKGKRKIISLADKSTQEVYNNSGIKLSEILGKLEKAELENLSLEVISKELEVFLKSEALGATNQKNLWENKIFTNYFNSDSALIIPIYNRNNTEEYYKNPWVNAIVNYNYNENPLRNLIQTNLLSSNLKLETIFQADLVAETPNPELQWNTNPFFPVSEIGGRYSMQGDFFKYYFNHQIVCWGFCLPYDMLRDEELIKFEVSFSVIDLSSQKNANLWNSFAIQMSNNSLDWKNSYIPAIQTWEANKLKFNNKYDTWKLTSDSLKNSINQEFNQKIQEFSMDGSISTLSSLNSETKSLSLTNHIKKVTSTENEILTSLDGKSLEEVSENMISSLSGIRNISLFTAMSDTVINSKEKYMQSLREAYSQEKVFDGSISKEIITNFLEGGKCSGNNFTSNSEVCTGYVNTYGVNKYESVVLDENMNLVFTKKIFTGEVIQTGFDGTNQNNYKMSTSLITFKSLATANIELASISEIDLFAENSLEKTVKEVQKSYANISKLSINEKYLNQMEENINNISSKNASLAQRIISEKMSASSLLENLASSLFGGTTVKEWIKSMVVSKVAESVSELIGLDKDLLIAYYNMNRNERRLNKMNNSLTGRTLPISIVLPLVQFSTNFYAELQNLYSNSLINIFGGFTSPDTVDKWREHNKAEVKNTRFQEYDKLVSNLDYKSQYKSDFKNLSYNIIMDHIISDPSIDSNQVSKLLQYLDQKKEEKKKEEEEKNKKILLGVQVATELLVSIFIPPVASHAGTLVATYLGSATIQAGIASKFGDNNVTAGTFVTALAGGLLRNYSIPLKTPAGVVSNVMKVGVSLSYTPDEKVDTLNDLISINETRNKAGWSAGVHLGVNGIGDNFGVNMGVNTSRDGLSSSVGVNFNQSGFVNLSNSNNNGNLGLTIGGGNKFGSSLGVVLNSVIPSSLFLSINPDEKNPMGLGSTVSFNTDGSSSIGIDLAKNEALTSTYSSSTGWSNLEANTNYQSELNNMNAENSDTNIPESSPLILMYGLMGLLGFTNKFKLNSNNSENQSPRENNQTISPEDKSIINILNEINIIQAEISNLENSLANSNESISINPLLVSLPTSPIELNIKILSNKLNYLLGQYNPTPNTSSPVKRIPPISDYSYAKENAIKAINGEGSVRQSIESFEGSPEEKDALKKEVFEEIVKQNNISLLKLFLANNYYSAIHPILSTKINSLNSTSLSTTDISSAGINYANNFQQGSATSITTGALAYKEAGIEFFEKEYDKELRKMFKTGENIASYKEDGKPTKYYYSEDFIEIMKKYSLGDTDKSAPNGNSYYKQAQSQACPLFTTYGVICSLYEKSGKTPIPSFADFLFKGIVNKIISPQPNQLDSMSKESSLRMVKVFGLDGIKIAEPSSNVKHGDNSAPPTIPPSLQIQKALDNKYPVLNVRRKDNGHSFMAELSPDGKNYIVVNTSTDPKSGTPLEAKDIYYILGYN
jgi:hypothetical protein